MLSIPFSDKTSEEETLLFITKIRKKHIGEEKDL